MSLSKETLKDVLFEQYEKFKDQPVGTERDLLFEVLKKINQDLVTVITGLRRSGKSTLTRQVAHKLGIENIYCINFEDERFLNFEAKDFSILHQVLIEVFGDKKIFIFDEVQNIEGWEAFVRRLNNDGNTLIITGSNAKLLSKEFGTKLTGRYHVIEVFPFSFAEYLRHKDIKFETTWQITQKAKISNALHDYLISGGIPLALQYPEHDILRDLLNDILYRDIIVRYKIEAERGIKDLIFYLLDNPSSLQQYTKLRQLLNLGSPNTVKNYIDYIERAWLLFTVPVYSLSIKQQQLLPKKILTIDTGLVKRFATKIKTKMGSSFENLIFLQLRRKHKNIFYYKTKRGKEIDFYIPEKNLFIQVCYDISEPDTKHREISGIQEALDEIKDSKGLIITFDEVLETLSEDSRITVLPAYKFLLPKDTSKERMQYAGMVQSGNNNSSLEIDDIVYGHKE